MRRPVLLGLLFVAACGDAAAPTDSAPKVLELFGRCMGTTWRVLMPEEGAGDAQELRAAVVQVLEDVEQEMSHYREESTISRFNRHRGSSWFPVSREFADLVGQSRHLWSATGGAFDVTCAPLVDLWGFGPNSGDARVPEQAEIDAAMKRTGSDHLAHRVDPPALKKDHEDLELNLSAIAKGHGVDRVGQLLVDRGVENWLVEVGGELRVAGAKATGVSWTIAVEQPHASGRIEHATLKVTDVAVATSGDYRLFWKDEGRRFSHIIDPRTGRPVTHDTASVSVFAATCAEADAWATTLLVLGAEAGLPLAEKHDLVASFVVRASPERFVVRTTSAYRSRF